MSRNFTYTAFQFSVFLAISAPLTMVLVPSTRGRVPRCHLSMMEGRQPVLALTDSAHARSGCQTKQQILLADSQRGDSLHGIF